MDHNKIIDINVLEKVNLKQLKKLSIAYNKINDIKVLEKISNNAFKHIYLYNNEFDNLKYNYLKTKFHGKLHF